VKIDAVVVDFDAVLIDSKDHQVTSSQVGRITGLKLKKLASLDGRATRRLAQDCSKASGIRQERSARETQDAGVL
jgi:hypothetical protein